jgi:hypothetical protein
MFRYWAAWIKLNMLDYLVITLQQRILSPVIILTPAINLLNNDNVVVLCIFSEFTLF